MMRLICLLVIGVFCNNKIWAQEPPQPFAPDIISQFENVRDINISDVTGEAYFTVQSPLAELSAIVVMKKQNGKWLDPVVASFSGKYNDLEPFLSADGLRMYFASNRPYSDTAATKDFDIWMVARKNYQSQWSRAMSVGEAVNSSANEFYPAITISGNLYFTCDGPLSKGKDDIFMSKWNGDHYEAPVSLSDSINSEGYEFNAYVAPDESFLVYTCYNRKDGMGSGDLYISYKSEEGLWTAAKNMGAEINSKQMDYCPFVSLKSKSFYFTSKRSNVVEGFTEAADIITLKKELSRYDNGLSRLYESNFKRWLKKKSKN
jgi:hypothetical protein